MDTSKNEGGKGMNGFKKGDTVKCINKKLNKYKRVGIIDGYSYKNPDCYYVLWAGYSLKTRESINKNFLEKV